VTPSRFRHSEPGPEQSIEQTSDEELAKHLCQTRAVFPFTVDGRISLVMYNACPPSSWQ
jgi:hypothetical protein